MSKKHKKQQFIEPIIESPEDLSFEEAMKRIAHAPKEQVEKAIKEAQKKAKKQEDLEAEEAE